MTFEDCTEIEEKIGYEFKNRMLLQQAFIRKSYTEEWRNSENNEVLEFIGDKVLDMIIVKVLAEYYGKINGDREFACEKTEGELTEMKKYLVEGSMLADRIDELGLAYHLIMGNGDRKNNVQDEPSVKEDLFEAILGAVALDSGWDLIALQEVVETMLNLDAYQEGGFEADNDYVSKVQRWQQKRTGALPIYDYMDRDAYRNRIRIYKLIGQQYRPVLEKGEGDFVCQLFIDDGEPFVGFGTSKNSARMKAAMLCYNYLEKNNLLHTINDEVGEPALERAVSQLQELAQKGYCSFPEYDFREEHDRDGNPIWTCECTIEEYEDGYYNTASSKKEAKKLSAYEMLLSILNHKNRRND